MQKVTVELVDDLDGGVADETVTFGLDGVEYEIDLSDENAESLRDALGGYVENARQTGGRRKASARKRATNQTLAVAEAAEVTAKDIREWLAGQGREEEVSPRGRIAARYYQEYAAQVAA